MDKEWVVKQNFTTIITDEKEKQPNLNSKPGVPIQGISNDAEKLRFLRFFEWLSVFF